MTTKYIRVTMPNGEKWDVSAETIARHRAEKITDENMKKSGKTGEALRNDMLSMEYNYTLSNDDVLIDWAIAHFNWRDILPRALRIKPPQNLTPEGYQKGWVSGHKEVVLK